MLEVVDVGEVVVVVSGDVVDVDVVAVRPGESSFACIRYCSRMNNAGIVGI